MIALTLGLVFQIDGFRAGLASDAAVLEKAYTAMHPGLYRYNSRAQIKEDFAKLKLAWASCDDLRQAYLALSRFTAKIRCGHTYPNFFNQDKAIVQKVFSGRNRVPFYFRWLKGHMVVLRDFTAKQVMPRGTEVESINGFLATDILRNMMSIARADGGNDYKREAYLSVTGDDRYEAFDIYLPLMFALAENGFTFVVRDLKGQAHTVRTQAKSMEDRTTAYQRVSSPPGTGDPWKLEVRGHVGILTMPSWQMYDGSWDWKQFLEWSFDKLKAQRVDNLVIDLRGDEGGSSVGDVLARYLVAKPVQVAEYHQYTRYITVDSTLKPYLDTWDRSFDSWQKWTSAARYLAAGNNTFFSMTRFEPEDGDRILPSPNCFAGRVFVLVDGSNSSATFEFENLVQSHRLAILVGEPTGGNLRGINGGAFYFLHLPNSRLEVDLPLIAQFPSSPQPDRGLTPDVTVYPTREDIAGGRDVVLERVMNLIAAGETR